MREFQLVWPIVLFYFALMLAVGLWASRRKVGSMEDMTVAGRSAGPFLIAFSIAATWINGVTLMTLTGLGKSFGLSGYWASGSFMLGTVWSGYYLVPRLRKLEIITLPQLIGRFWGPKHRLVSLILVFARDVGATAGTMGAMVVITVALLGLNMMEALLLTYGLTIAYVVMGGMWAVLVTDAIQFFLILVGSICVLVAGLTELGGLERIANTDPTLVSFIGKTGAGQLAGWFVLGFLIACGYQTLIQRGLAAKDTQTARRGFLYGGLLSMFWYITPFAIGTIGAVLYGPSVHADDVFLKMAGELLNDNLGTLVIVTLLAANMSTLSSTINTIASNFTVDIYKRFVNPEASRRKLFWISRMNVIVAGLLAAAIYYVFPYMLELFWIGGRLMAAGFSPVLLGLVLVPKVRRAPKAAMATFVVGAVAVLLLDVISGKAIEEGASVIIWQIDPVLIGAPLATLTLIVGTLLEVREKD